MNEEFLKQQAQREYENAKNTANTCGAALGIDRLMGLDEPRRASLRDRGAYQQRDAIRASRQADQLAELALLLERNPEVARILDLMEIVRG